MNIPDSAKMVSCPCAPNVDTGAGDARGLYSDPPDEDKDMTLCIAAECYDHEKSAVVLCRDWQARKGSTTSDDAYKQRDFEESGRMCYVLFAGSPTRADHLLTACEPSIREFMRKKNPDDKDIDTDKLLQDLKTVTREVRRTLIEDWVLMTLNMEFSEFRKHGRNELLESHYHDVWETIRRYDIGAELLVTLFDAERESVIIRTDGLGEVFWEADYSIIGTGGEMARSFLCQLDYDPHEISVGDCIYECLRAKFAAEKSREVGRSTTVTVTVEGAKQRGLSQKGYDYYAKKLLPYKIPKLRFDLLFLEDEKDDEPKTGEDTKEGQVV